MANAKNSQTVMRGLELEFKGDFILLALNYFAEKFDQATAFRTNQVIVVLMVIAMLISHIAIGKSFLACESAFSQKLERSINSSEADGWIFRFDKTVQIFGARMTFGTQKDFENLFALGGFFETFLFEMLEKDFFFLLHCVFLFESALQIVKEKILASRQCFGYGCAVVGNLLAFALAAKVAELADALGLGPSTARCGGSSPPFRTRYFGPTLIQAIH